MATPESQMYADAIIDKLERIISCCDDRSAEEINTRPPAPESNSLHVLAVHTMGNVREAVLEVLLGQPVNRDRDAEFAATGGSTAEIRSEWDKLKPVIHGAISQLSSDALDAEYHSHRRGKMTGRQLLLFTANHASEHVGHAELTRDWILSQSGS
jgi:uncharacterized damage-inducible protein DinB